MTIRIAHLRDPAAHSATAPKPAAASGATMRGAKGQPADAGARRLRAKQTRPALEGYKKSRNSATNGTSAGGIA